MLNSLCASLYLLTPWSRVLLEKLTGFAANQETYKRTDRRTVNTRVMVCFLNFTKAPKNSLSADYVGTLTNDVQEWGDLLSAKAMGWRL